MLLRDDLAADITDALPMDVDTTEVGLFRARKYLQSLPLMSSLSATFLLD